MHCFSPPDASSFGYVDGVIAVVLHGRPDVPTELAVASEGVVSLSLGLVNDCLSSDGSHGRGVEVEASKHLAVCR